MAEPKKQQMTKSVALALYLGLGSNRSARSVSEVAGEMGVTRPIKTIEGWITRERWVDHARVFDERTGGAAALAVGSVREQMNAQQARLGRAFQELASLGVSALSADGIASLTGTEVARLAEVGVKLERLATGDTTTRREISILTYNLVMMPVLVLIRETMAEAIPDDVERNRWIGVISAGVKEITANYLAMAEED